MPISKRDWLYESKPAFDITAFSPALVGALLAYSVTGHKGPFRLAIVDQVDETGFVTHVLHKDGSTENIVSPFSKRWVVQRKLTKSSREILEQLGDAKADVHEIRESIRPFVVPRAKEEEKR